MSNWSRIAVLLLLVFGVFGSTAAAWWDQSWEYRKPIDVSEDSGSTLNNYLIKLTVDTDALINNGKMQSDCGDIRFVDSDDVTSLDYWVRSGCGTSSTDIWIQVPKLSGGSTETIYMYYGNSGASSQSALPYGSQSDPAKNCNDIYQRSENPFSRNYYIDPDGDGSDLQQVQCDMGTLDTGWTLVLNYDHTGGNNPSLDEYNWPTTHTDLSHEDELSRFGFSSSNIYSVRFYCETSNHNRNVHFTTRDSTVIQAVLDDTTQPDYTDFDNVHQYGPGEDANLPGAADGTTGSGSEYLFEWGFPFYKGGDYHWAIQGSSDRWECDDYPNGPGYNTLHQVWVRGTTSAPNIDNPPSETVNAEQTHPDPPSSPNPSDGASGVSTSPSLSAYYDDPDGHSGTLTFYDGGGSKIGSCSVSDASSCSVTWSGLSTETTYDWYVTANDSTGAKETGATWSFTTNYLPEIADALSATENATGHAISVDTAAFDSDGDGDITSCTVFYTDSTGNNGSVVGTLAASYGNSTEASCNTTVTHTPTNVEVGEQLDITVQFTDGNGRKVNTTSDQGTIPNHAPTIVQGNAFDNASAEHMFNVTAAGKDTDAGSSELASCTVTHSDGESTYAATGNLDTSYGATDEARCKLRIAAEVEGGFSGYVPGEQVSMQVKFTDKHGATVTTTQTSNVIPNRQPKIHPPVVRFPSSPEILDEITVRANTSDHDDKVTYANFTIWEYNQDTANRVYFNRNGSATRNGTFLLWNSTEFAADLENATYNYSLTISDGFTTTRQSGTLFTLKAVSPDVSPASFFRPSPWGLPATRFRPGQSVQAYVTVTDANGRGDIIGYDAGVSGPSATTDTSVTVENKVLNGYNLSIFFSVPDGGSAGTWTLQTTATDEDTLQGSNSSSFQVDTYQDVTLGVNQSLNGTVYVDGQNATQTVYTDGEVEFPYAVRTWNRLLTGVINFGRFQQLTVDGQRLTMTQDFADNQFLLPVTEAAVFDLEQLQGQFTGGLLSGRSFLEHAVASIGYGTTDEKTVRVAATFADDPDITLHGFNSSLSSGFYELAVRKTGVENGSAVVRVMR